MRPEPGTFNAASNNSFPIWSCCGRGLPERWSFREPPGGLLPRLFTLTRSGLPAVSFLLHFPSCGIWSAVPFFHVQKILPAEKDFPLCAVRTFLPRNPGAIACQLLPLDKYTMQTAYIQVKGKIFYAFLSIQSLFFFWQYCRVWRIVYEIMDFSESY